MATQMIIGLFTSGVLFGISSGATTTPMTTMSWEGTAQTAGYSNSTQGWYGNTTTTRPTYNVTSGSHPTYSNTTGMNYTTPYTPPQWYNTTSWQNGTWTTYPSNATVWHNGSWTTPPSHSNTTGWQNNTWTTPAPYWNSTWANRTHSYHNTTMFPNGSHWMNTTTQAAPVDCYACSSDMIGDTCKAAQMMWHNTTMCGADNSTTDHCVVYGDEDGYFERRCGTIWDGCSHEAEDNCHWWELPGGGRACRCCCRGQRCNDKDKDSYVCAACSASLSLLLGIFSIFAIYIS